MNFFKDFKTIQYRDNNRTISLTNIIERFSPIENILENISIFYNYTIKDGETPRILAHKIYGSEDYDWIILMFNKRYSVYYDWPMDEETFTKYIEAEYGSIDNASQTIKNYIQIVQERQVLEDGTIIPAYEVYVDFYAYSKLPASKRRVETIFDVEYNRNEELRNIRIIDSVFIPRILEEKRKVLSHD